MLNEEVHIERSAVAVAVLNAVDHFALGFADGIGDKFDRHLLIKAFDREDFVKNLLQPLILAFFRRDVGLEEIAERIELKPDQIGNLQHILQFSVIDAFRHVSPLISYIKKAKNRYKKYIAEVKLKQFKNNTSLRMGILD